MLIEKDSRRLTIAMEALIQDFEPRDAIPFMCSKEVFNDDQQEAILAMSRRTLRVLEFIREYRKTAKGLDPLIAYFEQYGQKHLAQILSKEYVPDERPLLTPETLKDRLYLDGNVPRLPYYRVSRPNLSERLGKLLIELSSRDQFWLVIHGFPGCGKSFLAASILQSDPILLSRYYEHVIWVEDGRTDASELPEVFSNFVFLATDALVLTGKETPVQFLPMAKAALRQKPNTLLILNDIFLEKSVRWFDQLNCRILATSRNLEIFQVSSTNPVYFAHPSGFSSLETGLLLEDTRLFKAVNDDTHFLQIHKRTKGLPALLGILRQHACDTYKGPESVCTMLNYFALSSISHCTFYKYRNMFDAIMESYKILTRRQKLIMETFVIFEQRRPIPLELLSLCIPFDISGEQDVLHIALMELEQLEKLSFIEKCVGTLWEVTDDGPVTYDFQVHPVMHSFLCAAVDRRAIEDRLSLFIRSNVSMFLREHESVKSDFLERIRRYVTLHPYLFEQIPYEGCCQFHLDKEHADNGPYSSCAACYDKKSDNGPIRGKKSEINRTGSWTDSCIFM